MAIPLLFEAHWQEHFHKTICIWTKDSIRFQRLQEFRQMTYAEAQQRDSRQMSQDLKLEKSDFALINNFDLEDLSLQCKQLIQQLSTI